MIKKPHLLPKKLIVRYPFMDYRKGDEITDTKEIEKALSEFRQNVFIILAEQE